MAMLTTALELQKAKQYPAAEKIFRSLLQTEPNNVDALHLLGLVCNETGRRDEAVQLISQALRLKPDFADAHFNLGKTLFDLGRLADSVASYRRALLLNPRFAEAAFNLGNALRDLGHGEEAVASFRNAISIKPKYSKAYTNLGNVLSSLDQHDEAISIFTQALEIHPDRATAHFNLATALQKAGRWNEALSHCEESLRRKPRDFQALNIRGVLMLDFGDPEQAKHCFQEAILVDPTYARAHFNLGIVQLMLGEWEEGWDEYEWRWKDPTYSTLVLPKPRWDGSPLAGRTILLHPEQGFGDTLQFIRFASQLAESGGRVVVNCPPAMEKVLRTCPGVADMVGEIDATTSYDVHCPMLSLPRTLNASLENVSPNVPYLFADPKLIAQWGDELSQYPEFKVGIAWQGNPKYRGDRQRSIPLACFEPLAKVPGVRLFSLQKGFGSEQLAEVAGRFEITELGSRLDIDTGAFMDTAAVMRHLDLVIACDSAVNHLAGALGVQAWLLNAKIPNWRWLLHRADSPWYPTMRLFRQQTAGDWESVIQEVRVALEEKVRERFVAEK